jgi:hypothetical protein
MPISALSSNPVSTVREPLPATPADADFARSAARPAAEGERRHDLVDAMSQVLGNEAAPADTGGQAVVRFAHALMQDLHSMAGGAASAARMAPHEVARVWGQREWSDLPQRIDALATAAAAPAAATLPQREVPPQPNPLTTTTAAVHLMQVPSSRLLEAFAALRQAIGNQAPAPEPASRGELANFLERLANELKPDAPAKLPAGSVLNLTA